MYRQHTSLLGHFHDVVDQTAKPLKHFTDVLRPTTSTVKVDISHVTSLIRRVSTSYRYHVTPRHKKKQVLTTSDRCLSLSTTLVIIQDSHFQIRAVGRWRLGCRGSPPLGRASPSGERLRHPPTSRRRRRRRHDGKRELWEGRFADTTDGRTGAKSGGVAASLAGCRVRAGRGVTAARPRAGGEGSSIGRHYHTNNINRVMRPTPTNRPATRS